MRLLPVMIENTGSPQILQWSDQFQMVRPDAIAMRTATLFDVIPLKANWWFADEEMMSADDLARMGELAVPASHAISEPDGATIGSARINMRPETFFGCTGVPTAKLGLHRELTPCGVRARDVDASPCLSILQEECHGRGN
jgi:hypothetical protein